MNDLLPASLRACRKCLEEKPLSAFSRERGRLSGQCRDCRRGYVRAWQEENRRLRSLSDAEAATLSCRECGAAKAADSFGKNWTTVSGRNSECLECSRLRDRARYARDSNKRKAQAKWGAVKQKFGLTKEQWQTIFHEQDGLCAICCDDLNAVPEGRKDKRTACIDHDHRTGRVRGLLCARCNQGIGLLREDDRILARAIEYLEKFRQ